jgi:hypothetical protein
MSTIAASYVLPLRASTPDPELRDYVRWPAETVADVLVVDASPDEVRAVHKGWWGAWARHMPPDPARHCRNGEVWGVLPPSSGSADEGRGRQERGLGLAETPLTSISSGTTGRTTPPVTQP